MGDFLTATSVMMCPHGGQVQATPGNSRASASGALMLRSTDSFVIAGCPLNVGGAPHPCVTIKWVETAKRSRVGAPTLTTDSLGLCQAADQAVQGPVQIILAQTSVSGV
jgi:hypothetical protein